MRRELTHNGLSNTVTSVGLLVDIRAVLSVRTSLFPSICSFNLSWFSSIYGGGQVSVSSVILPKSLTCELAYPLTQPRQAVFVARCDIKWIVSTSSHCTLHSKQFLRVSFSAWHAKGCATPKVRHESISLDGTTTMLINIHYTVVQNDLIESDRML